MGVENFEWWNLDLDLNSEAVENELMILIVDSKTSSSFAEKLSVTWASLVLLRFLFLNCFVLRRKIN